jgi:hypothetical protein
MHEADWDSSTEPGAMLALVRLKDVRKLRLFAAACHRCVWQSLDEEARKAVEEAERLAEDRKRIASCGLRVAHADAQSAFASAFKAIADTAKIGAGPQAKLLRDIFGPLPFRRVSIPPSVRAWQDATVVRLSEASYECRRLPDGTLEPQRLFVLADALEEAGCNDVGILAHLRGGGVHVRGCYVLDLLLGKS